MSAVTIVGKLKTILQNVSATYLSAASIYKYQESNPTIFPAAMVFYAGEGEEKQIDTITNEVEQKYFVRLIFNTEEGEAAEAKWLTLVDKVKDEFRKDDHQTLTGSAKNVIVGSVNAYASAQYVQRVMVFDIILTVLVIKEINL